MSISKELPESCLKHVYHPAKLRAPPGCRYTSAAAGAKALCSSMWMASACTDDARYSKNIQRVPIYLKHSTSTTDSDCELTSTPPAQGDRAAAKRTYWGAERGTRVLERAEESWKGAYDAARGCCASKSSSPGNLESNQQRSVSRFLSSMSRSIGNLHLGLTPARTKRSPALRTHYLHSRASSPASSCTLRPSVLPYQQPSHHVGPRQGQDRQEVCFAVV